MVVLATTLGVPALRAEAATTCAPIAGSNNCLRFDFTGTNQVFVVPKGVTSVVGRLSGGGGFGTAAGLSVGTMSVTPAMVLNITVGGVGSFSSGVAAFGGGGAGGSCRGNGLCGQGGGGLSAVWNGAVSSTAGALLVAGGGGGSGANTKAGGAGGGLAGATGTGTGGGGGGGQGGGGSGVRFQGGNGTAAVSGGGGGGGGWFGGAGGAGQGAVNGGAGGGGGSGYVASAVAAGSTTAGAGASSANGYVLLYFLLPQTTITTPAAGTVTGDTTPVVGGTGSPGTTLTLRDQTAGTTICTTTVQADRSWTCTTSVLPPGTHVIVANESDPASPQAAYPASAPRSITVDTTPPAAPAITSPAEGSSGADNTPPLSGTGEGGATVTVTDELGAVVCTAVVTPAGTWACAPSAALLDGPHVLTPSQTDPAGNRSPNGTPVDIVVDTTSPPPPVISAPANDTTTANRTPTLTGTGEPGADVTVVEAAGAICRARVQNDGTWSCAPSSALADGSHVFQATQQDPVGNASAASAAVTIVVDTLAPAPPTVNPVPTGTDTTPTFTGTGEVGAKINASSPSGPLGCAEGNPVVVAADGSWRCTPTTPLPVGATTGVSFVQVDRAGNASGPATVSATIESPAVTPVAPVPSPSPPQPRPTSPTVSPTVSPRQPVTPAAPSGNQPSPAPTSEPSPGSAPQPNPVPSPSGTGGPNSWLPTSLTLASGPLIPGQVSSFVGSLGPNASSAPVTVTFAGSVTRGFTYRSVDSDPAGTCEVSTLQFSCSITLQPGQRAVLQVRLLTDALNAPDYARQQLTTSTSDSSAPNLMTLATRVAGPRQVDLLSAAITSTPGSFIVLLALLLFALAATETEKRRRNPIVPSLPETSA